MANIRQSSDIGNVPACLFSGTEIFKQNGTRWGMCNGRLLRFEELPTDIIDSFKEEFNKDKRSQLVLKQNGLTGEVAFDFWVDCRYGGYDETPDYVDGKLQRAEYNNSCKKLNCSMRGIVCKNPAGLNNQEVDTIVCIQQGLTITEIANKLCKSVECIKSRIKRIKEKLDAKNSTSAAVKAVKVGII